MPLTRRRLLSLAAAGAVGLPAATAVHAAGIEPYNPILTERTIRRAAWGGPPLRIAVLSDLHVVEPFFSPGSVEALVARTNALCPDIVALLGDFVGGLERLGHRSHPPESFAPFFARLEAPLGVHAVLGNHDWGYDGERVRRALTRAGVRVQENERVRLAHGGHGFWLVGLADLVTRRVRYDSAFRGTEDGAPVVVLSHNPDTFPSLPGAPVLTLAGHTHGGQVRLPGLGRPVSASRFGARYVYGLVEEAGKTLYTTSGLGMSVLPVRFGVSPEIALLTLEPGEAPA